jgi:hypothetical protein
MSKPVIYWCAAAVLAVGVVLMHVLFSSWAPSLSPELQTPITEPLQIGPGVKLVLMGYLALSVAGPAGVVLLLGEGVCTRDRQRWAAEQEAQRRLAAMERQIREEQMPAAERQRLQASRARDAAIRAEARRRLGLPEEDEAND